MKSFLAYPSTRGLNIDDPKTTWLRRNIIQEKKYLRLIYDEWYTYITNSLPTGDKPVVEIGSGAGFLNERIPGLISSEIFFCPFVRVVLNGLHLPFASNSLRAIVLVDVLHHIPDPNLFFIEATRCVEIGGKVIMIEPWVSPWSTFIFQQFHHEPFRPEAQQWNFVNSGPLSGANGALPWIIFERDRSRFEDLFPKWNICQIQRMMPFRYLLSGGVSLRSLTPYWTFPFWRQIEIFLSPIINHLAMFAMIQLKKLP